MTTPASPAAPAGPVAKGPAASERPEVEPPTTIDLREPGETPKRLVYNYRAFEFADARLGGRTLQILALQETGMGMSFTQVRIFLQAGLLEDDPALGDDDDRMRAMIDQATERGVRMTDIFEAVIAGIRASKLIDTEPAPDPTTPAADAVVAAARAAGAGGKLPKPSPRTSGRRKR